ncbi:MAG: hypothetical protein WCP32_02170 [Bacteroidota bacterium]
MSNDYRLLFYGGGMLFESCFKGVNSGVEAPLPDGEGVIFPVLIPLRLTLAPFSGEDEMLSAPKLGFIFTFITYFSLPAIKLAMQASFRYNSFETRQVYLPVGSSFWEGIVLVKAFAR